MSRFSTAAGAALLMTSAALLVGCASVKVTKVDSELSTAKGQRYYLPKPVIQVAPQLDGTVAVSVLYLPDKSRAYAIDAQSWMSAFSLQVLPNPDGTLSGVYYQGDTTPVAQQALSSASVVANQMANYQLAQAQAHQANVATAQAAVDTAQATADAANAAVTSDKEAKSTDTTSVLPTTIAADESAAAQAAAKLAIAKQALARTQSQTPLPSSTSATAGTLASTDTSPNPDSTFTGGTWTAPSAVPLPNAHPAALFMLNDTLSADGKTETVTLTSAVSVNNSGDAPADKLPDFGVSYTGLGPPTLITPTDPFSVAGHSVTLQFSRAIVTFNSLRVLTGSPEKIVTLASAPVLTDSNQAIQVDTTGLAAGTYKITFKASYSVTGKPGDSHPVNLSASFVLQ